MKRSFEHCGRQVTLIGPGGPSTFTIICIEGKRARVSDLSKEEALAVRDSYNGFFCPGLLLTIGESLSVLSQL